jgi:hypothetical protein
MPTLPLEVVFDSTGQIQDRNKNAYLPTNNFGSKILKRGLRKALDEDIPKLLSSINLQSLIPRL